MISKENIEDYKNNLIDIKELSIKYNKDWHTIKKYILDNNIKRNFDNEKWLLYKYSEGFTIKQISEIANCSDQTIKSRVKKFNLNDGKSLRTRKHSYNLNFFNKIDNEKKAYWLGFVFADGYISNKTGEYRLKIELSIKDISHLEIFKNEICSTLNIKESTHFDNRLKNPSKRVTLKIYSKEIVSQLISLGMVPGENHRNIVPTISEELIPHFIRGYLDGDGCITTSGRNQVEVKFSGGFNILNYISQNINNISSTKNYPFEPDNRKMFILRWGGNINSMKIKNFLYSNSTIHLSRKYNKIKHL